MVVSFDLGGSFSSSTDVVQALSGSQRFAGARVASRLSDRVQPSYRYSHEPDVLACEEEIELQFTAWKGAAVQQITLHPAGVITFEITMLLGPGAIERCTRIEEDFYKANVTRYLPYLRHAFERDTEQAGDDADAGDVSGLDLISPVLELRALLGELTRPRPQGLIYPATDMRTVVTALTDDLDTDGERLVEEFVHARRERAQLAEAPKVHRKLEGRELDMRPPTVAVRRWGCVLFASCDVDAVLLVGQTDEQEACPVALDCVAMAQRMWFVARTWVGVLDQIGTVEISDADLSRDRLQKLETKVIALSAAEFEIESSMATVEAASVMLRDTWHVQLVGTALETFEVDRQRRLVDSRLGAVARNHATVAEILDRAHQNAARDQADRLQYLFAVAVAAGIASLVLSVLDLADMGGRALVGVGTVLLVWVLLAVAIWWLSSIKVRAPQE